VVLRPRTPFVGRTEELAALRSVLGDARRATGRVAMVVGHAGSGKTRLVEEALAGAAADFRVLRGACTPVTGAGVPYAPIVAALRPVLDVDDSDGSAQAPLERWPALGVLTPGWVGREDQPSRLALFEGVLALLRALAARRPVAVWLDDMHWADRSTADLAGHLAVNLADDPALLVLGTRPDAATEDGSVARVLAEVRAARLPTGRGARAASGAPERPGDRGGRPTPERP
jgi:hypothetical protein